ncbi:hypothetical protein QE152_g10936 [Popillia japonica]|uniref:Uncharacterized protein n=1 Tax=Popillia japonica TaxID=7064 RepID=A0AAW1LU50_POPJA
MLEEICKIRDNQNNLSKKLDKHNLNMCTIRDTNEDTLVLSKDDMVLPLNFNSGINQAESDLGTMVVNSDTDEESCVKRTHIAKFSFGESRDIKTQSGSYRSQTNSPVSLHTFIQQVPLVNADLEYLKYF